MSNAVDSTTKLLCEDTERDLEWLRSMRLAVADALEQHRQLGNSVVVLRDEKPTSLAPGDY